MHPAYSIIIFTTLTGIGYGLGAMLGLGLLAGSTAGLVVGYGLSLVLVSVGLLSSTGHLRHPERAWRALSQWRSSWLSREGVLAILTFIPLGLSGGASFLGFDGAATGIVGTVLCVATVVATSMIYASLRSVWAWHSPLTTAAFLAFAAAGGLVAAATVAGLTGAGRAVLYSAAAVALAGAWGVKALWWQRAASDSGSTVASATGLGRLGPVRLFERPHGNENYLTREMGFQVARRHAGRLRLFAITAGAVVPLVCMLVAALISATPVAAALAVFGLVAHFAGVLVERWLFFAEARHTVSLYYGAETA